MAQAKRATGGSVALKGTKSANPKAGQSEGVVSAEALEWGRLYSEQRAEMLQFAADSWLDCVRRLNWAHYIALQCGRAPHVTDSILMRAARMLRDVEASGAAKCPAKVVQYLEELAENYNTEGFAPGMLPRDPRYRDIEGLILSALAFAKRSRKRRSSKGSAKRVWPNVVVDASSP